MFDWVRAEICGMIAVQEQGWLPLRYFIGRYIEFLLSIRVHSQVNCNTLMDLAQMMPSHGQKERFWVKELTEQ